MRILILSDLFPPQFTGGYEIQCDHQVRELESRGHEVFVLTSRWRVGKGQIQDNVFRLLNHGPEVENLQPENRRLERIFLFRRIQQIMWAINAQKNYRITKRIISSIKPDIAYIWNMDGVSIRPLLAVQEYGIPLVFNLCDYWLIHHKKELRFEPNKLKRAYRSAIVGIKDFDQLDVKHLLLPNQSMLEEYTSNGFPVEHINVIPLGLPDDILLDHLPERRSESGKKLRLGVIGRLHPWKGQDLAVDALAYLRDKLGVSDIELDVIGIGIEDYEIELRRKVVELGLEGQVHFKGKLEYDELVESYATYDFILFTSRWKEPFGLIVIESMARGVPVIASKVGGPSTTIKDGITGLLVPPSDPVMLAKAVKKLIDDPAYAEELRFNAIKDVSENYTISRIVDQVEPLLRMALEQAELDG